MSEEEKLDSSSVYSRENVSFDLRDDFSNESSNNTVLSNRLQNLCEKYVLMDEEEIINLDKEIEKEIRNMSERNINCLFDTISQS